MTTDELGTSVRDVGDLVRAAAYVAAAHDSPSPKGEGRPEESLLGALSAHHRRWLGGRALRLLGIRVPPGSDDVVVGRLLSELSESSRTLDELGSPLFGAVHSVRQEAYELQPSAPPVLLAGWIREVRDSAELAGSLLVGRLRKKIGERGITGALEALEARRYSDALMMLDGGRLEARPGSVRETAWRADAEKEYQDAAKRIGSETVAPFSNWRPLTGNRAQEDRSVRAAFVLEVFGKEISAESEGAQDTFPCAQVRKALSSLNPTYVPQLSRFHGIVVTTPPTRVTANDFAVKTASIAAKNENTLTVFLTPHLTDVVRRDTLKEFRKHSVAAALLDDVDLCRIFTPGRQRPNPLLAFLEVVWNSRVGLACLDHLARTTARPFRWRCTLDGRKRQGCLPVPPVTPACSRGASWGKAPSSSTCMTQLTGGSCRQETRSGFSSCLQWAQRANRTWSTESYSG